ncbi:hypothetical protein SQW19_05410 [Stenotrophomonas acidaminiphila]|uniref:hypothetical protein n=1 Tax=Stenotrophomonas acidaminiphila TaxID=128780 RepID=UPI002ABDA05C|nr:hypothetical protein [Stenotrophomonas acidaminiphila]WPU57030.1 hypothetical protein SQW19_05410 [Stenotrophomonas acidaminiphila]
MAIAAKRTPQEAKEALAQRRAKADARAKAVIEALRNAGDLRRHQAAADALEGLLARATGLRFGTLADLLAPQPWALDEDGNILGHLLTVEDVVYLAAVADDRVDGLTLGEAFSLPWVNLDEREVWTRVYADALRALADEAEGQLEAQRRREALRQLASKE